MPRDQRAREDRPHDGGHGASAAEAAGLVGADAPGLQGRVCAATDEGEFQLRQRLYELEERLEGGGFVRISNSELINLKRVRSFDLSLAGTIRVSLTDGSTAWASRRYVAKLRKTLGL